MDATLTKHIEASPGLAGGRPRIAGTRVRIQDIVACHEFQGMTPDQIVAGYPHITLADVYAALTYYHDNRDEIQGHMKADEEFVARFKADQRARLAGGDGDADSLSSR